MNWKLIFRLSLFGLAMGIATISLIPANIEPAFWLVILIISAYLIAKNAPGKYFQHGFMVSIVNCIWIIAAHVIAFRTYLPNHSQEMAMWHDMPMANHTRSMMVIGGLFAGVISGIVLGLFSLIASKIVKKKQMTTT